MSGRLIRTSVAARTALSASADSGRCRSGPGSPSSGPSAPPSAPPRPWSPKLSSNTSHPSTSPHPHVSRTWGAASGTSGTDGLCRAPRSFEPTRPLRRGHAGSLYLGLARLRWREGWAHGRPGTVFRKYCGKTYPLPPEAFPPRLLVPQRQVRRRRRGGRPDHRGVILTMLVGLVVNGRWPLCLPPGASHVARFAY